MVVVVMMIVIVLRHDPTISKGRGFMPSSEL
jgi:hypothetical protein